MMRKNRILLLLFFAVLSVLFFLPMLNLETMRLGVTRGDDYPFHYARISSIIEQIKATGSSQFVASFGSHEIFYGANIFYPPLTSAYPIAVLAIAFNSFISGYYVYLALLNFITLWFAYICSCYVIHCAVNKENQKNLTEIGAVLFSIFYTFSQYRLICVFERMALGEYVALTFYPLVFAGFYSVVFDNGKKRFWLIIGMTLLAYTHLLSLLLVTAVLGLLFLFCLVKKKITYQNMLTLVLSAVVMLCLSAASLGPLLLEMISFQIRSVHSYNLQDRAYSFSTALSDSLKNWIDYKSIGIFVLVVLGAGIISYFTKYAGFINKNPVLRLSLGLTAFFSMAMTTVFPWHLFQNTPVRIMQFPFRLMSFLMLFASFFAAVVTAKWLTIKKRRTWIGMVLMGLGIIMLTMFTLTRFISDQVRGPLLYSATEIEQTKRYQTSVNKDYFPKGLTKTQSISIVEKKGDVNGEKQAMPYSFSGPNAVFHLVLKEQENKIDLPIIAYIGMEVTDEQEKRIEYKDSSRKTVQIELPEGEHRINVHFVPTLFMKFCMFLSAGTAAVLSIVYIADRKRKK